MSKSAQSKLYYSWHKTHLINKCIHYYYKKATVYLESVNCFSYITLQTSSRCYIPLKWRFKHFLMWIKSYDRVWCMDMPKFQKPVLFCLLICYRLRLDVHWVLKISHWTNWNKMDTLPSFLALVCGFIVSNKFIALS